MKRYVEVNPRTRRKFFIALILWCGLLLVVGQLNDLLPPLSEEPALFMDQVLGRFFWACVLSTTLLLVLSVMAIRHARHVVQTKQWPPIGTSVPFRTKVVEVNKPILAWLYLASFLVLFAVQACVPWYKYSYMKLEFQQINEAVRGTTQPAPQGLMSSSSPSSSALPRPELQREALNQEPE